MFTYKNWHRFCAQLSESANCITAEDLTAKEKLEKWVVIKHDVEAKPKRALKLAKIENIYGIRATYYFQASLIKDNLTLLKKIAALGHEVSYHYDVLDACSGDLIKAENEFDFYVGLLRANNFPVRTVCPHGNPVLERNGWNSNKDFFRNPEISKRNSDILDIVVQSEKVSSDGYTYISDAGYTWNIISNVDSNDLVEEPNRKLKSIDEVINVIGLNNRVIISTHPHRWGETELGNYISRTPFVILKFLLKPVLRFRVVRVLLSPFYSIAKRF